MIHELYYNNYSEENSTAQQQLRNIFKDYLHSLLDSTAAQQYVHYILRFGFVAKYHLQVYILK